MLGNIFLCIMLIGVQMIEQLTLKWQQLQSTIESLEKNFEKLKIEKSNLETIKGKIQNTELKTRIEKNLASFEQVSNTISQANQKSQQLLSHLQSVLSPQDFEQLVKSKKSNYKRVPLLVMALYFDFHCKYSRNLTYLYRYRNSSLHDIWYTR